MKHADDCTGAVILSGGFVGLGAARCLSRRGVGVHVVGQAKCLARHSRSVERFFSLPPDLKEEDLPGVLVKMADDPGVCGSVLFPVTDTQLRIVAQNDILLAKHYILTTPPWDTVKFFYDKRLTYTLAREEGIAIPQTHVPGSADRLAELDIDFPVVVKPAIAPRFWRKTWKKACRADNRQQLRARYEEMSDVIGAAEVIVQELLPDPSRNLFSFAGYFRKGEPVEGFAVKRTRQFPNEFSFHSTYVETIDLPELKELATKLLLCIPYTGLAEVEFMWDEKQSRFALLEVNARLWAWNSFTTAVGLDLPYVAYAEALGQHASVGPIQHEVKWIKLLSDVRSAAHDIRAGRLSMRQYLASLRGKIAFAVLSAADPVPFIVELSMIMHGRLKKLASRIGQVSRAGCKRLRPWRAAGKD